MGVKNPMIKGFLGTLVGITLGGEAIRQAGSIGNFPSGLKSATQSFIGLGIVGHAAKPLNKIKWLK